MLELRLASISVFFFLTVVVMPVSAGSRLLATSGATAIEGQAGGGLVPWALISGYAAEGEVGATLAYTRVAVDDFTLDVSAANVGWNNRVEVGYARQSLEVQPLDLELRQDIFSGKIRLFGDLVYTAYPQVALGLQYKRHRDMAVPRAIDSEREAGTDLYLSASKLWLDAVAGRNLFANLTFRRTAAHQNGLLGHGDSRHWQAEGSLGVFVDRYWVWGVEYRSKPDHLAGVSEDDWMDSFVGWFPNKRFAAVLAWADLGSIAGFESQRGWYLSLQFNP